MNLNLAAIRSNRRRRVVLGAGVATLAFSLALSIAPALAKTSGTVKIHDAQTNTDIDASLNDPQVCTFTVVFDYPDPVEAGTWRILSWAPTGDGSQAAGGTYDTTASGIYQTDVLTLDAGHYRLEWMATGAHSSRNKTFWVKCAAAGGSGDESTPSPAGDPNAGSQGDDNGSANGDQNTGDGQSSGDDESGNADQGNADQGNADNGGTTDSGNGSVDNGGTPDNGNGSADNGGTPDNGKANDQSSKDDPGTPSSGSDRGAPSQSSGSSHEGDVKGITSPVDGSGPASLPNTAFKAPTQSLNGILTVIGLLLVIAAHPLMRRSANPDRA